MANILQLVNLGAYTVYIKISIISLNNYIIHTYNRNLFKNKIMKDNGKNAEFLEITF